MWHVVMSVPLPRVVKGVCVVVVEVEMVAARSAACAAHTKLWTTASGALLNVPVDEEEEEEEEEDNEDERCTETARGHECSDDDRAAIDSDEVELGLVVVVMVEAAFL